MLDVMPFLGGADDSRWTTETRFGSGVARALVWRITTGGAEMAAPLAYEDLAVELEFTPAEIRAAVTHLLVHGFARIERDVFPYTGDVLVLLTPGRLALDAALTEEAEREAAERAARITRAGGRERRDPIPAEVRAEVFERDGHRCVKCGAVEDLTLDHIHPWSLGGPDTADNLRVLCRSCNSRKNNRLEVAP